MSNMPSEVCEYFHHGSRLISNVAIEAPYSLIVSFDDGQVRRKDMSEELTGVMAALKDKSVFRTAHARNGLCVVWDTPLGEIDIDKDAIYIYGEKLQA